MGLGILKDSNLDRFRFKEEPATGIFDLKSKAMQRILSIGDSYTLSFPFSDINFHFATSIVKDLGLGENGEGTFFTKLLLNSSLWLR
jgi:hypothetical protein